MSALTTFSSDLATACSVPPTWAQSGNDIGTAIDTFMQAVKINTIVNGAITSTTVPPVVTPVVNAPGKLATLVVSGTAALISSCVTAYTSATWALIGTQIGAAILTYIPTVLVNTSELTASSGVGSLVPVAADLPVQLSLLYGDSTLTWPDLGQKMATKIAAAFTASTLITIDGGVEPNGVFVGAGIGTLSWS